MPASRRLTPVLLAAFALAAPAAASAQSTGGTAAPTGEEPMIATPHATLKGTVAFDGTFAGADAGRTVTVERFDPVTGTWVALATATIGSDGRWSALWRADVAGRLRTRASLASRRAATDGGTEGLSVLSASDSEAVVTVYRRAVASWYGPGFYGRKTACRVKMTRSLLGVAHKKLPCGTEVALLYRGGTITVPVVDRGPYIRGRNWDLTSATAKALGFEAVARIGAVALR
jgi:hypothetical protein